MGVTTVSNSLILGGWVTNVLKNGDKNSGGRVSDNNILTFLLLARQKGAPSKKTAFWAILSFHTCKVS